MLQRFMNHVTILPRPLVRNVKQTEFQRRNRGTLCEPHLHVTQTTLDVVHETFHHFFFDTITNVDTFHYPQLGLIVKTIYGP